MLDNENNCIEYKEILNTDIGTLEKPVIAFLNSKGGKLIFGITDNKKVVGVNNIDELQTRIANRITDNILPNTAGLIDIYTEEKFEKLIVIVKVAVGIYTPYYLAKYGRSPKGVFYRLGSTTHSMTEEMINNCMLSRSEPPFLTNIESYDNDLKFRQLRIYFETNKTPLNENFAKTLCFFTKAGRYNKLAELFADENNIAIKVLRHRGKERGRDLIQNDNFGNRCILSALDAVKDRLNSANITQSKKTSWKRIDQKYIRENILREAIINAFVHNDYTHGNAPIFDIFDDRFEITSYGNLLEWISKEDFFTGTSHPRNPEMMNIFMKLHLVEGGGTGIPDIVRQYGADAFYFSKTVTRITLKFDNSLEKEAKLNTYNEIKIVNKTSLKILKLIKNNQNITIQTMADILKMSSSGIRKNLNKLKKENIITRTGSNKSGLWQIVTDKSST